MTHPTCDPTGHDFFPVRRDYYKRDGGSNCFGATYDQSVTYTMLACRRCGETREVCSGDQRGAERRSDAVSTKHEGKR